MPTIPAVTKTTPKPSVVGQATPVTQHQSAPAGSLSKSTGKQTSPPKKAPKDPNAPKRPANAFFVYCNTHRDDFRAANPLLSKVELNKALSQQWKEMPDDQKSVRISHSSVMTM